MGIFTRFTFRSLARNRVRTVVSAIGIALSCALLTSIITSAVSLSAMLERRTAADEGSWQVELPAISRDGLDALAADARVKDVLAVGELGAVELGEGNAADYGAYAFIKTWPAAANGDSGENAPLADTPSLVSGRAPSAPGELLLPHYFEQVELDPCGIETEGAIDLGSELTLRAGTRTIIEDATGDSCVGTSFDGSWFQGPESERFAVDLPAHSGTVVGFYRAYGLSSTIAMQGNSIYVYDGGDAVRNALADGSEATTAHALLTVKNPQDALAIGDEYAGYTQGRAARTHTSLLRWQGVVTSDAAIWNTLYMFVTVLAGVIIAAGVSLIYNSFAISVAERTKQFGLLSSLGASRRQLRRTVYVEALLMGVVGIPVGVALGLAGCAVVFRLTGEGLAAMTGGGAPEVVVSAPALAIASALALITLLISAAVPALRASSVSAVDAIRQSKDVQPSRRERRALRRAKRAEKRRGMQAEARRGLHTNLASNQADAGRTSGMGKLRNPFDRLRLRFLGVPGLMAHRNLTRAAAKGRVTVGALAVSVALLIISGSIADTMGYAGETSLDTMDGNDLAVRIDAASAPTSEGGFVRSNGTIDAAALQASLERWFADARELGVEGAKPQGYATSYVADAIVPAEMIGDARFFDTLLADGAWAGPVYADFLDDASWRAYVEELGLPESEFCDKDAPRAIAQNSYRYNDSATYDVYEPLAQAGTVEVFSYADLGEEGLHPAGVVSNDAGERVVRCMDDEGREAYKPLDEMAEETDSVRVGALGQHAPRGLFETGSLRLILPASAIDLARTMGFAQVMMRVDAGGSAQAAADMQEALEELAASYPELDFEYSNYAESAAQARLMADAINVFIFCFTIVTGLIAVANVFNTLTNSLMLRQREFAVLKSIGMGERAFRRMIAHECASYALRGFLVGLALACGVAWLMYDAMRMSYGTYEFTLPWLQVGIAAVVVLAVILASVAFALRKSGKTGNVVETLRMDAV